MLIHLLRHCVFTSTREDSFVSRPPWRLDCMHASERELKRRLIRTAVCMHVYNCVQCVQKRKRERERVKSSERKKAHPSEPRPPHPRGVKEGTEERRGGQFRINSQPSSQRRGVC